MPIKQSLSVLLTESELDCIALKARIKFYRDVLRQLEDILGSDGDKETLLDAAKRAASQVPDLKLKLTNAEESARRWLDNCEKLKINEEKLQQQIVNLEGQLAEAELSQPMNDELENENRKLKQKLNQKADELSRIEFPDNTGQ